MVLDCFRMYCVTFETYFTVDCTCTVTSQKANTTTVARILTVILCLLAHGEEIQLP